MTNYDPDTTETLRDLHRSLDERWRPEDVARRVLGLLDLGLREQMTLKRAAGTALQWSSMSSDFHRPVDMRRQLRVGKDLFDGKISFAPDDIAEIDAWIRRSASSIGKDFGNNSFQQARLTKEERVQRGIDLSRRQYNKRFRFLVRCERKMHRLAREQFKRSITLASKNRLAARISWEDFSADANTACFIAYYVARCNLRSVFTNTRQARPYDKICDRLMQRCQRHPEETNWWAIAHVLPSTDVLCHLDDEQKGVLVGDYFVLLQELALFLQEIWAANEFRDDMVVRRGNDSTTWNVAAGAWNKLREGWFSLMYDMGLTEAIEQFCPGKVLRLMAADVARWHTDSGGDVHADTYVWRELPRPWEVMSNAAVCPKALVDKTCRKHKLDPVKSNWSAPRPLQHIEEFTPTPELVHGVEVASPILAAIFRKSGVFSRKPLKRDLPWATVAEVRMRHLAQQERRKSKVDESKAV